MRDEGSYEAMEAAEIRRIKAVAIAQCALCNDAGYRGHIVCDHRLHSTPEARQRARALVDSTINARKVAKARKIAPEAAQPQESASGGVT